MQIGDYNENIAVVAFHGDIGSRDFRCVIKTQH